MLEIRERPLAALIATLFLAPAAALAQQTEQQLPEVRVQDVTVREGYRARDAAVGVLGDRPLIDTPYSINVIPRQLLENQQAAVPNDIVKNDPSATLGNLPIPFFSLRGFAVGTDGFLYDGLPGHIGLSGARGQIEGIERIEVLKGPSAFLNGFGAATSVGGALNYVPKRPGNIAVRALTASYTSRSLFGVHGDLGDRFGADRQFGYRVNLAYKDGEQAVSDARWTHEVAALALDWRATPNVLLNAGFDYVNNHTPRFQPFFSVAPGFAMPSAPKASRNLSQPWTNFRQEDTRGYLRADWAFAPDWSFSANYLIGHTWRPTTFGGLNVLLNNAGDFRVLGSRNIAEADYQSGQALVRGRLRTGALKHELTAGVTASWLDQKGTPPNVGSGVLVSNLYAPSFFPDPFTTPLPAPRASQKFTATGLVLSDVVSFSEQWSVLVGARHAKLDLKNFSTTTGAVTKDISPSKTSPTLALMFKPQANVLLYTNYAEGLEQGGVAPAGTTNQNQTLPPIIAKQLEAGAKLDLPDLTLTAAVFDLKKPFEFVNAASNTFVQSGEQEHRGVEFLATGRVTSDLTLMSGVMLLDPKTNNTGNPASEGKRPLGVPKINLTLYGEYRLGALPGFSVTAAAYHSGEQFVDAANTQRLPSWTRFDIGARYATRVYGRRTTLLFNVENVADRDFWSSAQGGLVTLGEPRTFKASAKFDL